MRRLTKRQMDLAQRVALCDRPVTGRELAAALGCSVRTVQSEVSRINADEPLITSTNRGYAVVSREVADRLLRLTHDEGPSAEWAILRLITKDEGALSVDDIAQRLYMSAPAVERRIRDVRKIIEAQGLRLVRQGGALRIEGDEDHKRSLIGMLVSREATDSMAQFGGLSDYLDDMDIGRVRICILSCVEERGWRIRQGYAQNLITSIAIALYRMRLGSHVSDSRHAVSGRDLEREIARALCESYSLHRRLDPTTGDIEYLASLLSGQIECLGIRQNDERESESVRVVDAVRSIVNEVLGAYQLEVESEQAFHNFAIHVQALVERRDGAQVQDTSALENIKMSCPFIYELSVLIAWRLGERFEMSISDGEVGFICIHVGMLLLSTLEGDRVRVVLACDRYQGIADRIRNVIQQRYDDLALIREIDIEGINRLDIDADVVITTRGNLSSSGHTVLVSPFFTTDDRASVERAVAAAVRRHSAARRRSLLEPFFADGLFLSTNEPFDRDDLILTMGGMLQKLNVVDENFVDLVLKRESLSSTCMFNTFAVPHSIEMDAARTMVCVALCHGGVTWDERPINIVLMIAVCRDDRRRFLEVYDTIVRACSDRDRAARLAASSSLSEFLDILVDDCS